MGSNPTCCAKGKPLESLRFQGFPLYLDEIMIACGTESVPDWRHTFPVQAHIYILNGHGFEIVGGSKLAYVPVNNPFMWRSGQ